MKKLVLTFALAIGLLAPSLAVAPTASAVDVSPACNSGRLASTDACQSAKAGKSSENPVINLISIVVNVLSVILGAVSVIILIVSGIRFMTSQGDAQGVSQAKSAVAYALIGLVIIAMSQVIVRFVLNRVV